MNRNNANTQIYSQKVELLLRLMPLSWRGRVYVHGGTAINLFLMDLPRLSVDIDLTYIPLAGESKSLEDINQHLKSISEKAKKTFKGMHIVPKYDICKLLCEIPGQTSQGGGEPDKERTCR